MEILERSLQQALLRKLMHVAPDFYVIRVIHPTYRHGPSDTSRGIDNAVVLCRDTYVVTKCDSPPSPSINMEFRY
jgi:hypothetical protein